MANFIIGTIKIPEVKGVYVHTLAINTGPWAMFHLDKENNLYPSLVFSTLKLLRESSLEFVLNTDVISFFDVGKIHAVVLCDKSQTRYVLWATNCTSQTKKVSIMFDDIKKKQTICTQKYLSDQDINASNRENKSKVLLKTRLLNTTLDKNGKYIVELPPNSITTTEIKYLK